LAGFKKVDLQTVQTLRDLVLRRSFLQSNGISSQDVSVNICVFGKGFGIAIPVPGREEPIQIEFLSINICISDLAQIVSAFRAWLLGQTPEIVASVFADLQALQTCAQVGPSNCNFDFMWLSMINGPNASGFNQLSNSISAFLRKIGANDATAQSVSIFVHEFLMTVPESQVRRLIEDFGALAIVSVGLMNWLNSANRIDPRMVDPSLTQFVYTNSQGQFDILSFFTDLQKVIDYAASCGTICDLLRSDVIRLGSALAAFALASDMEQFYRTQETLHLANIIKGQNGWTLQRLWLDLKSLASMPDQVSQAVDIIATGQLAMPDGSVRQIVSYVLIEPFLTGNELGPLDQLGDRPLTAFEDRLMAAMRMAANPRFSPLNGVGEQINVGRDPVVVIVLNSADPAALDQLKALIHELITNIHITGFGVSLTVIVVVNGQVVYSEGLLQNNAQEICTSMGICQESTPTSPPSSSGPDHTIIGGTVNSCQEGGRNSFQICAQHVFGR